MKRRLILSVMIFVLSLIITGCRQEEEIMKNSDDVRPIPAEKSTYATVLGFSFKIVIDGEVQVFGRGESSRPVCERIYFTQSPYFDSSYTELIFVHSEEEATGFPNSTVVAWLDKDTAQGIINGLHLGMLRGDLDLEDFGLVYPITVENLVDDWEAVNSLRSRVMVRYGLSNLPSIASRNGAEAFLIEIEAFHVVDGDRELLTEIINRANRELGLNTERALELLTIVGCPDEFLAIVDRLGGERYTLEEILEKL